MRALGKDKQEDLDAQRSEYRAALVAVDNFLQTLLKYEPMNPCCRARIRTICEHLREERES